MPGNETLVRSPRSFLPVTWKSTVQASQSEAAKFLGSVQEQLPLPRNGTITGVLIALDQDVTAGGFELELTRNGALTGKKTTVSASTGTRKLLELAPGQLEFAKEQEIGINVASNASFQPSGALEVLVFIEVQFYG